MVRQRGGGVLRSATPLPPPPPPELPTLLWEPAVVPSLFADLIAAEPYAADLANRRALLAARQAEQASQPAQVETPAPPGEVIRSPLTASERKRRQRERIAEQAAGQRAADAELSTLQLIGAMARAMVDDCPRSIATVVCEHLVHPGKWCNRGGSVGIATAASVRNQYTPCRTSWTCPSCAPRAIAAKVDEIVGSGAEWWRLFPRDPGRVWRAERGAYMILTPAARLVIAPARFEHAAKTDNPRRLIVEAVLSQPIDLDGRPHRSDSPPKSAAVREAEKADAAERVAARSASGVRLFHYPMWARFGTHNAQRVTRALVAASADWTPPVSIERGRVVGTPEQIAELIRLVMAPLEAERAAELAAVADYRAMVKRDGFRWIPAETRRVTNAKRDASGKTG